jgi:glycosyltransferase involved in cell wall biosynthesis
MTPIISVYCLTYNHEKYIRQTLEGFVRQKTDFPFEVIVHDDASTDKTAEIIHEYAEKYPDVIIPILQKENQYSKGASIFKKYIYPILRGKYIAICEGDDYWCDENKMQRQYNWLEANTDYSLCVHNTKVLDCSTNIETILNNCGDDRDISTEEIINKASALFHTSSYMFRSEYALLPLAFVLRKTGDYSRAVYLATQGKVRYLHDVMSVYRKFSGDSWTSKMYRSSDSTQKQIAYREEKIKMLQNVDEYTQGLYSSAIQTKILTEQLQILKLQNDIDGIRAKYHQYYKTMSIKTKMLMKIKNLFPSLYSKYLKMRTK